MPAVEQATLKPEHKRPAVALSGTGMLLVVDDDLIVRRAVAAALSNLGYHPTQVKGTLDRLFDRDDMEQLGFAACLKTALQEMSTGVARG